MARLNVSIEGIAALRGDRGDSIPDPVAGAVIAELAGADSITAFLNGSEGGLKERDVRLLGELTHKLNLEITPTDELLKLALAVKPYMVTLVPVGWEGKANFEGVNLSGVRNNLSLASDVLHEAGIAVSLFIEPDLSQIRAATKLRSDSVELYTGLYAKAKNGAEANSELDKLEDSAQVASKLGLTVIAGGSLSYSNVSGVVEIEEIEEVCIGHHIVSRGLFIGLEEAVSEMMALVR